MYYLYIFKSINYHNKIYVGITENLKERLTNHNKGSSEYTSKFKPWKLETYIAFNDKDLADEFEKYLKSGSGRAFLNKRFLL